MDLKKEVDRMLTDSRINRFIDDFSRQWLQLHRVGMFPPDKKLYPDYDDWLETSMRAEPVEYFREMFAKNLPIDGFLDSDWTMANARLCDFYGLPEPKTGGFQRVSLKPEDHRGGLLTMGAVLGLTSDGTRHRPVHRGVWVSEAIFNKTPPPPPANVDPIEPIPPDGPKVTIRQRIEAHAKNANCAACHRNIDPLGLAFDQYDAIGQWRTREQVPTGVGEDPLVDASGVMPDGRPFNDSVQFKQLLLEDRDKVARAFIEHLCTYALRRVLTVDDQDDLKIIEERSEEERIPSQGHRACGGPVRTDPETLRTNACVVDFARNRHRPGSPFQDPHSRIRRRIRRQGSPTSRISGEIHYSSNRERLFPMSNFLSQSWLIDRRHALRALGTCISLPMLECMIPLRAAEQQSATPRRSAFIYLANGVHSLNYQITTPGKDYEFSRSLKPLEKHREVITPISGLHHPGALSHHHNCISVWLTGGKLGPSDRNTISVDQKMAEVTAQHTRYPSMEIALTQGSLAWTADGVQLPAMRRCSEIFASLFEEPKGGIAAQRRALRRKAQRP